MNLESNASPYMEEGKYRFFKIVNFIKYLYKMSKIDEHKIKVDKIDQDKLDNVDLTKTDNLVFKMLPQDSNMKLGHRYLTFYIAEKLNAKFGTDLKIFESIFYDRSMFKPENIKKHLQQYINDPKVIEYAETEMQSHLEEAPRPSGPLKKDWLSNVDEDEVLKNVMEWCPWFYANKACLSDFMVDYTVENPAMASRIMEGGMNPGKEPLGIMEPIEYKNKGYTCMGCIVNLDVKPNGGTHWVGIFYDARDNNAHTIEYFNSSGEPPRTKIRNWMQEFADMSTRQLGVPCKPITVSTIVHQRSDSECGAYAAYFVISRVIGINYKKFREGKISDLVASEFRKCMFRK